MRRGDVPRSRAAPAPRRAKVTPTVNTPSTTPSSVLDEPRATTTKVGING